MRSSRWTASARCSSYEKFLGGGVPREVLPTEVRQIFCAGGHEMLLANSSYESGTEAQNALTGRSERHCQALRPQRRDYRRGCNDKDLIEVADVDFRSVSIASIAAVFLIIAISFRSASIPVLLVGRHRKCHYDQYGHPYFTGTTLPFVANIVIGTIQLLAQRVDYAILMTTRFLEELNAGRSTKDADADGRVEQCSQSILNQRTDVFRGQPSSVSHWLPHGTYSAACAVSSAAARSSACLWILLVLPALLILTAPLIRKPPTIGSAKKRRRKPYEKLLQKTTAVLVSAALAVTCALPAFAEQPTEGVTKDEKCVSDPEPGRFGERTDRQRLTAQRYRL